MKTKFIDKKEYEFSIFFRDNLKKMEDFFNDLSFYNNNSDKPPFFFDMEDYSLVKILYHKELNEFLLYKCLFSYNSLNKGIYSFFEYLNSKFFFFFPRRFNIIDNSLFFYKKKILIFVIEIFYRFLEDFLGLMVIYFLILICCLQRFLVI